MIESIKHTNLQINHLQQTISKVILDWRNRHVVLYYIVLYCTVLYGIALHYIVLYSSVHKSIKKGTALYLAINPNGEINTSSLSSNNDLKKSKHCRYKVYAHLWNNLYIFPLLKKLLYFNFRIQSIVAQSNMRRNMIIHEYTIVRLTGEVAVSSKVISNKQLLSPGFTGANIISTWTEENGGRSPQET